MNKTNSFLLAPGATRRSFLRQATHVAATVTAANLLAAPASGQEATSPRRAAASQAIDLVEAGGLQAALDLLPPHGGTIFIPAGTHRIERPCSPRSASI